jgi:hypothetical protein
MGNTSYGISQSHQLYIYSLYRCCYIKMVNSEWENLDNLFCLNVSFLFAPHCQCRGVGQDGILIFQTQWAGCHQQNHKILNYFAKRHCLYSGTSNERISLASYRFFGRSPQVNKGTGWREE